jgi:hypothetical protein
MLHGAAPGAHVAGEVIPDTVIVGELSTLRSATVPDGDGKVVIWTTLNLSLVTGAPVLLVYLRRTSMVPKAPFATGVWFLTRLGADEAATPGSIRPGVNHPLR